MKKVLLFSIMFMLVMLGIQGVGAEEIIVDEVLEPTAWDNWIALITDFASLKNAIVSIGGVAGLVSLLKVRGIYRFLKSPDGLIVIEKFALRLIGKVSESPEIIMNITKLVVAMPMFANIVAKLQSKANMYETEVLGKILDMELKLEAKVFSPKAEAEAITYLAKLRDEYETLKLSE